MSDDHCHEGVTRRGEYGDEFQPCGNPPVAYRIDVTEDAPYPVCRRHHRPPYWLDARDGTDDLRARLAATEIELRAARLALAACRDVREARES